MNCICCDCKILPLLEEERPKEYDIIFSKGTAESIMWLDGTVGKVSSGYGSIYDGDIMIIGICDNCLGSKVEAGKIAKVGNYMFKETDGDPDFKNSKNWLRNKNLNDLC